MLNKVILIGRTGKDPETRYMDNGNAVCNITLATSETYKDRDGNKVENTEWHKIVLWKKLAEITDKYVKKGDMICIVGKIKYRSYEDQSGVKKYITEINADEMKMISSKGNSNGAQQESGHGHDNQNEGSMGYDPYIQNNTDIAPGDEIDDLPF